VGHESHRRTRTGEISNSTVPRRQRTDHRYAKIYAGDEGRQIFETYAVAQEARQIPRAIAYSETHHLLLLESVAGVPLSTVARKRERIFPARQGAENSLTHQSTIVASARNATYAGSSDACERHDQRGTT
jgi:hypothetical protein